MMWPPLKIQSPLEEDVDSASRTTTPSPLPWLMVVLFPPPLLTGVGFETGAVKVGVLLEEPPEPPISEVEQVQPEPEGSQSCP
jgi:hypothetical protein